MQLADNTRLAASNVKKPFWHWITGPSPVYRVTLLWNCWRDVKRSVQHHAQQRLTDLYYILERVLHNAWGIDLQSFVVTILTADSWRQFLEWQWHLYGTLVGHNVPRLSARKYCALIVSFATFLANWRISILCLNDTTWIVDFSVSTGKSKLWPRSREKRTKSSLGIFRALRGGATYDRRYIIIFWKMADLRIVPGSRHWCTNRTLRTIR